MTRPDTNVNPGEVIRDTIQNGVAKKPMLKPNDTIGVALKAWWTDEAEVVHHAGDANFFTF